MIGRPMPERMRAAYRAEMRAARTADLTGRQGQAVRHGYGAQPEPRTA